MGSHPLIVSANGLNFQVEETGAGPAVLLLHGFPDTGDVWRHQAPALAAAGLRTIVPDLRGRGRSERPQEVAAYAWVELVADATGILDAFGIERAHIVGHDWGAALAWAIAALAPERVDRLVVISVGFPGAVRPDRRTLEQGWYRLLVLFPEAEDVLLRDDAYLLRTLIAGAPDADRYLDLLADREALTAGLAWYRANSPVENLPGTDTPRLPTVAAPTLGVFGEQDPYLTERAILASQKFVTGGGSGSCARGVGGRGLML
jgi:pimeloyl-ACP methyl ester carboxylesterase